MADECLSARSVVEQQGKEERGVKGAGVFLWWLGMFLGQDDCGSGSEDNVDLSVSNPCCPQPFCKLLLFCFRGQLVLCRAALKERCSGCDFQAWLQPEGHYAANSGATLVWRCLYLRLQQKVGWAEADVPAQMLDPVAPTCFSPWVALKHVSWVLFLRILVRIRQSKAGQACTRSFPPLIPMIPSLLK